MSKKTYGGSCHCGAVAFTAKIDFTHTTSQRCNCSICAKSRTWFIGVPAADVEVQKGMDHLADYTWIPEGKTPLGLHYRFCRTCGIRPFVEGQSEELGGPFFAVAIAALDDIEADMDEIVRGIRYVDGRHDAYKREPADTRSM